MAINSNWRGKRFALLCARRSRWNLLVKGISARSHVPACKRAVLVRICSVVMPPENPPDIANPEKQKPEDENKPSTLRISANQQHQENAEARQGGEVRAPPALEPSSCDAEDEEQIEDEHGC